MSADDEYMKFFNHHARPRAERNTQATPSEVSPERPVQLGALGVGTGWTAPSAIPSDVARKIIAARDALLREDTSEAWHQLYSIADPRFESVTPWAILEAQSNIEDDRRRSP